MPYGIAVDGTNVYWATDGDFTLWKLPLAGGSPVSLGGAGTAGPATDGINVYVGGGGEIVKVPVGGGTPTTLVSLGPPPDESYGWDTTDIATDGTNVYWVDQIYDWVRMCAVNGCGGIPTTLAASQNGPSHVAVNGTGVYWINSGTGNHDGAVQTCAISGCGGNPTTLASGLTEPWAIAVNATHVFWSDITEETVMECDVGGCGGTPTTFATQQSGVFALALDGVNVYWSTFDPSAGAYVVAKPMGGGPESVMATFISSVSYGIAADSTRVYWTDYLYPTSNGIVYALEL